MRGMFTWGCVAVTLGVLLLALNSSHRNEFLAPGPLTKHHSQILSGPEAADRCAKCHPAGNHTTAQWLLSSIGLPHGDLTGEGEDTNGTGTHFASIRYTDQQSPDAEDMVVEGGQLAAHTQGQLCMKCHEKTLPAQFAWHPHSLPPEILEAVSEQHQSALNADIPDDETQTVQAGLLGSLIPSWAKLAPPTDQQGRLACAACHREHHGVEFNLAALSDSQCQNCHQRQFDSFEHGHPEFQSWPYTQRQRIAFDHVSHAAKHYQKENQEFQCQQCHQQADGKDVVSVVNYSACYECHENKLQQSLDDGIVLIKLPLLDTEAMLDQGVDVGQWPIHASGEFDGVLPPLLTLMLSADPVARNALDQLGTDFDFYDADPDDADQMKHVGDLVWGIKRLINDLATDSSATWRSRISTLLGVQLSEASLSHLHMQFSNSTFALCRERWFMDLNEDVKQEFGSATTYSIPDANMPMHHPSYRVSDAAQAEVAAETQDENGGTDEGVAQAEISSRATGWQISRPRFDVRYLPTGHNDPFMAVLLDVLAGTHKQSSNVAVQECWDSFAATSAVGQCTSCHSVDQTQSGSLVHWRAKVPGEGASGFTQFSHSQHLIQPQLQDCSHCHHLNPAADFQGSYQRPPHAFESNFHPLEKLACVECHNQSSHKDSCTTCHKYHVHMHKPAPAGTQPDAPPATPAAVIQETRRPRRQPGKW